MAAAVDDHRPVVAGRPQRRLRLGAGARATSSSAPSSSGSSGPSWSWPGPGSASRSAPGGRHRRPARWRCRVDVGHPPARPSRRTARRPRCSSGRAGGGARSTSVITLRAGPARRARHGDARHRLGRAVRAAVVDAAGCGSPCPSALHVAPRCGRPEAPRSAPRRRGGRRPSIGPDRRRACPGAPARTRPGDNRRLVHWRATAHAGDADGARAGATGGRAGHVTVDLPADPDEAERVAERALGTVVRLLEGGAPVLLATREPSGPVLAPVADRRGAGRRLARAVARRRRGRDRRHEARAARRRERSSRRSAGPTSRGRPRTRSGCGWPAWARCSWRSPPAPRWTRSPGRPPSAPWCSSSAGMAFSYRHPGPAARVGQGPGGGRRHRRLRLVLPRRSARRRRASRRSMNPLTRPARLRPGGALLPRAVPARPAVLARRVGRPDGGGRRAQAIDLRFGLYVVAWACFGLWGLTEMWTSASGGGRMSASGLVLALVATSTAAAAVFLVLPAPVVSSRVSFICPGRRRRLHRRPGGLAGDSGSPAQLSRAGSPQPDPGRRLSRLRRQPQHGPARQPGQHAGDAGPGPAPVVLGGRDLRHLAGPELDGSRSRSRSRVAPELALRPADLARATCPSGRATCRRSTSRTPPPTSCSTRRARASCGSPPARSTSPTTAPSSRPSAWAAGPSTRSIRRSAPRPRRNSGPTTARSPLPPTSQRQDVQLPHAYPRVLALARSVTAGDTTTYDKVQSLIALDRRPHPLLRRHPAAAGRRRHGRRVPLRQPGRVLRADLHVARRHAALPRHPRPRGRRLRARRLQPDHRPLPGPRRRRPRLGPGVVPGLRVAELRPDGGRCRPTSPSPGATALHDVGAALRRIPPVPVAVVARGRRSWSSCSVRWRRSRPATWAERVARSIERAGRRAGRPRRPSETLAEYAARLDELAGRGASTWGRLASSVEASAYGGHDPPPAAQRAMVDEARRTRVVRGGPVAGAAPDRPSPWARGCGTDAPEA